MRVDSSRGETPLAACEPIGEPSYERGGTITATVEAQAAYDDDSIFDAASYNLPVPKIDGRKATKLDIRFSGSGALDRTSDDDLALLEAMRIGAPVRLIVTGEISGKSFRLGTEDEKLAYSCTVRVASVEAGEIA